MPFPPPVSKTMGRWSLPVLVDLLKTRATAALVTDLCAFRWRVICLRRAECFTKLMNIHTTLATTERNYSTKWVTFVLIWGLAGSIREVTQSPLQSFPVKLEHELGGSNTTKSVPKRLSAIWDAWESWNVSLWNPEYRKILRLQESRIPLNEIGVPNRFRRPTFQVLDLLWSLRFGSWNVRSLNRTLYKRI